jgi:hypothetical protein
MQHWLQGFSYRENVQWWVLFYPALGAVLIAGVAIGSQSVKAAMVNPAEAEWLPMPVLWIIAACLFLIALGNGFYKDKFYSFVTRS